MSRQRNGMAGRLAAASFAALMAGCTVGPDFHPPLADMPSGSWGGEPAHVARVATLGGAVDASWWTAFHDPELTSLVMRLAAQNLDLQAAAERVQQGRAVRRIAASQGLPHLDANGAYTRTRPSPAVIEKLFTPAPGAPAEYDLWQDDLSASWEIDLFGRVRREVEAQRANTEAAIEARHAIALMAIADLAQAYLQLRGLETITQLTRANLADADANAALVRNRFGNGVATTLDIANAEAQRATLAASLPPLLADTARLVNAVGILLALPPRALEAELHRTRQAIVVPPTVPLGVPAELARRRPDVRQAEARLHAATAETGVAVADFYPDVKLTGQIGTQALQFPQAFNLMSGTFMVGPTIDLPIFEGGRLRATLHLRRSQQREAALDYRGTVLQAWQDVDNALTAYAQAQQQREATAEAARQTTLALDAARQRYRQGVVDFLNVLSAQAALLRAQRSLAEDDVSVQTDLVSLYRALGGGWQVADR